MFRLLCIWIGWLLTSAVLGQAVMVDSLPGEGYSLTDQWRFRAGDDPDWSRMNLDESAWKPLDPSRPIAELLPFFPAKVGWLRVRLRINPALRLPGVVLTWRQTAASELFVNGQRLRRLGTFPDEEKATDMVHPATEQLLVLTPDAQGNVLVAVRLALTGNEEGGRFWLSNTRLFAARLQAGNRPASDLYAVRWQRVAGAFTAGLFFVLALVHGLFFVYNTSDRANGVMALACLAFSVASMAIALLLGLVESYAAYAQWALLGTLAYPVGYMALVTAIYTIYQKPFGVVYFLLAGLIVTCGILLFVVPGTGAAWAEFGPALLATAECSRVTLLGRRQWGGGFITSGLLSAMVLFSLFCIYTFDALAPFRLVALSIFARQLIYSLAVLCIPLSISLYIARSFVFTQRRMTGQLLEVQRLSKQSFEQEKERQTLLARQKETLERQVVERTAQLQQSLDELQTTQNQLVQKEKMASLGELTAGIAHEIQNPLNFVNNFSEVSVELVTELEEELVRPASERDAGLEAELLADLGQNLTKISHHGQRASAIVRNMLQHSRTSSGQREATDLNALADEYLRLSYHGLRAKDKNGSTGRFNASFRAELAPDLPPVRVVAQDIGRVLLNLFNNAFYAVQQRYLLGEAHYQPTVTVKTEQVGKQVILRVRDNGMGIPDDLRGKIFQPFFTTKPTGEGTGLGLSLSYDIITKGHGGTLDVVSEPGQFTEFCLTLPLPVA